MKTILRARLLIVAAITAAVGVALLFVFPARPRDQPLRDYSPTRNPTRETRAASARPNETVPALPSGAATVDFAAAAEHALTAPPVLRRDEIIAAFHAWGRAAPEAACAAVVRIADAGGRELALQSVFSGWAREDPAALADAAIGFPEGTEKDAALTKAIRAWMIADPERAGEWVFAHASTLAIAERVFRDENR